MRAGVVGEELVALDERLRGRAHEVEHVAHVRRGHGRVEKRELEARDAVEHGLGDDRTPGLEEHAPHERHEPVGVLRGQARRLVAEQDRGEVGAPCACRLDCVPPEVSTPSPTAYPTRRAVHATTRRSMRVATVDWSNVSTEVLIAASIASAPTAGSATGQLRWAAYAGSWNHTAWVA